MKPADRNLILYLEDILQSMQRIEEYIFEKTFDEFTDDYKTVDAVIRNFEIIGEAAKNVPIFIKNEYPNVPWEEMYRLRNLMTHEYFGVDHEILWNIATTQLPQNQEDIQQILTVIYKGDKNWDKG